MAGLAVLASTRTPGGRKCREDLVPVVWMGAGGIEKRGTDKISPLEPRNPSFLSEGHMGAEPGFEI